MRILDNGQMTDDDDKEDDFSEAIFARQFTKYYNEYSGIPRIIRRIITELSVENEEKIGQK